jgi:hypothetical protein
VNSEWVKDNIREAIEELQGILDSLEGESELPSVGLAHAYYHLNAAYRGALTEQNPYDTMDDTTDYDYSFRYFPTDLPELYGTWFED